MVVKNKSRRIIMVFFAEIAFFFVLQFCMDLEMLLLGFANKIETDFDPLTYYKVTVFIIAIIILLQFVCFCVYILLKDEEQYLVVTNIKGSIIGELSYAQNREMLNGFGTGCEIHAHLSTLSNNKLYSLVPYKFSNREGRTYPIKEALVSTSLTDGFGEIIYVADKKRMRIVGVDMENNIIYLYKANGKIYRLHLDTGRYEIIQKHLSRFKTLYFSWEDDLLNIHVDREAPMIAALR